MDAEHIRQATSSSTSFFACLCLIPDIFYKSVALVLISFFPPGNVQGGECYDTAQRESLQNDEYKQAI